MNIVRSHIALVFILFLSINVGIAQIPCNVTVTSSASGCCNYTLDMDDALGDGWQGGFVTVNINGSVLGNYSASGSGTVVTFAVCNGDVISLRYTSGGILGWENENSYYLLDGSGNVLFSDGPIPSTGVVFTSNVSCGSLGCNGGFVNCQWYWGICAGNG